MNDLDLVLANEVCDLDGTQDAERVTDGNVKDIFRRKEPETMLPVACRSQGNKHFVTARCQASRQIDEMSLGAAIVPCRGNLQYLHEN